jgi:hypothetical protein
MRVGEGAPVGLGPALVELVDLRPAQRVAELSLGNAPERVAAPDDICARRVGGRDPGRAEVCCGRFRNGQERLGGTGQDQGYGRLASAGCRKAAAERSKCSPLGRSGCEGESGDDDSGDEPAGDRLEDPGERKPGGLSPGERGGDLNGDGGDEHGPGDPDSGGEGVDEGLVGNASLIEGVAELGQ